MPPVAAMLPAVSEAREVVSRLSTSPLAAMSWPFLSTMKTTFAFALLTRWSTTVWIWLNSSSYITIWSVDFFRGVAECPRRPMHPSIRCWAETATPLDGRLGGSSEA
jgi:hypothetical protein